jgi:Secretion system C-terminal sorting domain
MKPNHMKTTIATALKISLTLSIAVSFTGLNKVSAQQNASSSNNLPALLMSFSASSDNNTADLNWVMENETNCKWFVIERSGDAGGFDSLNVVAGLNNSHATTYNFSDANMLKGNNYYRLRQVDRDGVVKYSKVVSLYNSAFTTARMEVYPNPASAVVNYTVSSAAADQVTVQVYNLAGVVMMTRQQQLTAGSNQQSLAISNLKNGNYFLKIVNREGTCQFVQSFVKVM